jgi:TolB-like protein/predicted Ser/Thr protein kinase
MGEVYRARDEQLRRDIAIKILQLGEAADDETRRRLLREARAAAALNHPSICTVHEVGEADGRAYIAMEFIDGRPLSSLIEERAVSADEVHGLVRQLAEGLAHAHARGVVHGDLKPANAIVTADGRVKLVDFGLARHVAPDAATTTAPSFAAPGVAAGTLAYMAPEQLRGAPPDARSDVWALGTTVAELAANSGAAERLRPLVSRCLERDPARRYATGGEVRDALEALGRAGAEDAAGGDRRRGRSRTREARRAPRRLPAVARILLAAAGLSIALDVGGLRSTLLGRLHRSGSIKLAVLPFANMSERAEEYFSDGLTDEMIAQLGRLRPDRLGVVARTSAMGYKGTAKHIDQIGRELGVEYVLEGTARREGDRVRITAALIRVKDEARLWDHTFDRELSGILALQSEVAHSVARELSVALLPDAQSRLGNVRRVDPAAYASYLRGRAHVSRLTPQDLDEALRYFEEARTQDPGYALAYAGIAEVWVSRQQMFFSPRREALPQAKAAAERAVALDDGLPEAHLQLATISTWSEWDWEAGGREFERALDLDPNNAAALRIYSHYLHLMKRTAEANSQSALSLELDPLNPLTRAFYGAGLLFQHRWEESVAQFNLALAAEPNHVFARAGLATALHNQRKFAQAFAAERAVRESRHEADLLAALDRGYAAGGYPRGMREAADVLAKRSQTTGSAPLSVAQLYLKASEWERAVEWTARAFEAHDPNIPYLGIIPTYEPVRSDPRIRDLIRRLNLPE